MDVVDRNCLRGGVQMELVSVWVMKRAPPTKIHPLARVPKQDALAFECCFASILHKDLNRHSVQSMRAKLRCGRFTLQSMIHAQPEPDPPRPTNKLQAPDELSLASRPCSSIKHPPSIKDAAAAPSQAPGPPAPRLRERLRARAHALVLSFLSAASGCVVVRLLLLAYA